MRYKTYWLAAILLPLLVYATQSNAFESKLSGGYWHSVFINNSNVYGMGKNTDGEISTGPESSLLTPIFTGVKNAKSVAGSPYRTAVLKYDGTVELMGRKLLTVPNKSKQHYFLPAYNVSDIALTQTDLYYISAGKVYKWDFQNTPTVVSSTGIATEIAAGDSHLVVLYNDGTVGTMGKNSKGQLGNNDATLADVKLVTKINASNIVSVAAGASRSLLITNKGTVLGFGSNSNNELGLADKSNKLVPTEIPDLVEVNKIATGTQGTIALLRSGQVMASGWHGYISQDVYNISQKFTALPGVIVMDIGFPFDYILVTDGVKGRIRDWGSNLNGKLGDGTTTERHNMSYAYFTVLANSTNMTLAIEPDDKDDPICKATKLNPFAKVDVQAAVKCGIAVYSNYQQCTKENASLKNVKDICNIITIKN